MKDFMISRFKQNIVIVIISAISLVLSIINFLNTSIDWAWIAVILCGVPMMRDALIEIIVNRNIKAGVLVSIALVASVMLDMIFVAGEVSFIMALGTLLEDATTEKTQTAIKKLLNVLPKTVKVIENNKEKEVLIQDVKVGDIIRVVPGEVICFDGVITKGETSINQAYITGESMPQDKTKGDKVYSGTLNQFGTFNMKVTEDKENSSLQKLVKLVEKAELDKVKIVRKADIWATWVVIIALSIAILTFVFTKQIIRSVSILVVFCPCALVLATPTAIMAGVGNASKNGVLIKNGIVLEIFKKIKLFLFDKTGTLTYGNPEVTFVKCFDEKISTNKFINIVGNLEKHSEHIIGKAISKQLENKSESKSLDVDKFKLLIGKGVEGIVEKTKVVAGNLKLFNEKEIKIDKKYNSEIDKFINKGATIIYVAFDNEFKGFFVLEDTIKEEVKTSIDELKALDTVPVLITGDNAKTANSIAKKLGIKKVYSECSPEDKLKVIDNYKKNWGVCMIGDGINDAAALKKADVGIAMGKIGSDMAIDSADIVLISDDLGKMKYLNKLSNKVIHTIYLNLTISMTINFVFVTLSIIGMLTPVQGAIVHNIGSFGVILNSALLLRWKPKNEKERKNKNAKK